MDDMGKVTRAISEFPFWNYGMDNVSFAIEEDPEAQEWIPALAEAILTAIGEEPNGKEGTQDNDQEQA